MGALDGFIYDRVILVHGREQDEVRFSCKINFVLMLVKEKRLQEL
jgi:hypothetical protein